MRRDRSSCKYSDTKLNQGDTQMAKAPAKAAKPAAKSATVTLKHLGAALAEKHNLPKKQTNEVLIDMVSMITTHLKKGSRLRIGGLDRKSTRLNSSHIPLSRMPSSA